MKVLPVAILVLLGFAAFFMTFLVAPIAVLGLFYVGYSIRQRSSSEPKEAPPQAAQSPLQWGTEPEPEPEEEQAPAPSRRGRVVVESHRERAAAQQAAADDDEDVSAAAAADGAAPPEPRTATTTSTEP